jgi:CO dehydrogenase maturation factor
VRGLVGELGQARPNDVTILDNEASIEHMTRGTVRTADVLLMVTEPYYRSLETTGRLVPLARELGIPHLWAVANKLRTPQDEAAVREYCERHDLEVLSAIPFDEQVTEADNAGVALLDHAPGGSAARAIAQLVERLLQRLEAARPVG